MGATQLHMQAMSLQNVTRVAAHSWSSIHVHHPGHCCFTSLASYSWHRPHDFLLQGDLSLSSKFELQATAHSQLALAAAAAPAPAELGVPLCMAYRTTKDSTGMTQERIRDRHSFCHKHRSLAAIYHLPNCMLCHTARCSALSTSSPAETHVVPVSALARSPA
jgi:hypothetical protein